MSSFLPYDVITQIIDKAGENDDITLIRELALVSHSFNQICTKHLFATVNLYDEIPMRQASSKKAFVKLLTRRPDVVKYIRKLTYKVECGGRFQSSSLSSTYPRFVYDDHLLSPVLPNFLRTISFLNCLTITASKLVDYNTVDSSLTSALLHLMHLPTINHIDLSSIENFPLYSLIASKCVNLRRLDISYLKLEDDGSPDIVILPEVLPKFREFHTSESSLLTTKLLLAETQDRQPAFNFMDLRRLSISSMYFFKDEWNLRYLLQNATLLEKLHLSIASKDTLESLHDILSPSARTLKELDLIATSYSISKSQPLGLCEELKAMAGNNMLEAFSLEVLANGGETEDFIGSTFQEVEEILVKPGWSALRQVSFRVAFPYWRADLTEALESLPDNYLSHLSKLESVAFDYNCNVDYYE
jgi:hypothetical protein